MHRILILFLLILLNQVFAVVLKPQLKWAKMGGGPYIMDGTYAGSPAVADLNQDGKPEVIWANYMLYLVDGATGNPLWKVYTGHDRSYSGSSHVGRTWPAVAVADLDGDGDLEIVTAHERGHLAVYNHKGYFHNSAWPKQPCTSSEIRSMCVADMDGDGKMEISIGTTRMGSEDEDWYIFREDGTIVPGWPQTANNHCKVGGWNQNHTVGDLDKDGQLEMLAFADVFYLNAFNHDGSPLISSAVYGRKIWAKVPIHVSYESELRGWRADGENMPGFPYSAPVMVDVNNDSELEVVTVSNIYIPETSPLQSIYHTPMIFNSDRTRFQKNGFDWREFPVPADLVNSKPLCSDWRVMKFCLPNPAVADLDQDGFKEILFPSFDGKFHVYWLDKTEHHQWPFNVYQPGESTFRFATEPIVADLDNDGLAEVIFGSWTQIGSQQVGKLHILDATGKVLHELSVPENKERTWNGITSAPTIANIDADPDYELVVGTAWTGLCAYDLPGTSQAKIYWQTGQANFQRTGSFLSDSTPTNVERESSRPDDFKLVQNYPNPFYEFTHISFTLDKIDDIKIEIFDLLGRKVAEIFEGRLDAGKHEFKFSGEMNLTNYSTGIYLVRIKSSQCEKYLKMIYLKH